MRAGEHKLTELPRGWVWARIAELTNAVNPGFPSGKHNRDEKGVPHLRPMNISSKGEIDLSDVKYVQPKSYDPLEAGDVLFNNTNSPALLGKTALVRKDTTWAYSNHMTRIRLSDIPISPAWIAYYLHTLFLRGYFRMQCVHHVNQASVSRTVLTEKVAIPLAPLAEQRRIVAKIEELFTRLDAGVEALKKVKAELKRYRQAVLKHAFEGKLTAEWRKAHKGEIEPASKVLERIAKEREKQTLARRGGKGKARKLPPFDKTNLPELPDGWEWARLEDCTELVTKGESPKWQGFDYVREGVPFIRSENVLWGAIDLGGVANIPEGFHDKLKRSQVRPSDVLVNLVGASIGRSCVVPPTVEKANLNQAVALIRLSPALHPNFLMFLVISPDMQRTIHSGKVETARPNISLTDVKGLDVPVPPSPEQRQIVSEIERHFSIADEVEQTIEKSLKQSDRLRQSILKKAFEGKLVPQDTDDEPAEKLLERIGTEKAKLQTEQKAKKKKAR